MHAHVSEMGLRNMREVSGCYSLQRLTLVVVRRASDAGGVQASAVLLV